MIELVDGRKHEIIKRDGRSEPYTEAKLYNVLLWAAEGKETYAKILLDAVEVKVFDRITISKLFDEVISTAANLITEMAPYWDTVARNLYLQKIYKETWAIKRSEYPDYIEVLKKGVSYGIYDREVVESFSEEEIQVLNDTIQPKRDFDMDYLGLRVFIDKYSLNHTQTKILELPQHGFMRLALFAFWKEDPAVRLDLIKKRYDDISSFRYSEATPKWLSSLGYNPQMASCVVSKIPDTSWGINRTISNLGLFSKYGGGLAADVSSVRAQGSKIGKSGKSSGPIPFIKMIEATITGYNQLGKRNGACCVTFPWWHFDSPELIELKEEGGTEDRRARKLQYSIKWNKLFTDRILANEDITLFDPRDTPELLETWGDDFNSWYKHYEEKSGIRKKVIPAIDLAFAIVKQRIESGNLYVFLVENVQNQNNFNDVIYSSNLCQEITLPTKEVKAGSSKLIKDLSNDREAIIEEYDPGLIALCNLSSINLMTWKFLSEQEKEETTYNLLRASDNLIDYAFYPAKEGERFNRNYRAIGVGVTNYARFLADAGLHFEDKEAEFLTSTVTEDIYWYLMNASIRLSGERGRFKWFDQTKYAQGKFAHDLYQGPSDIPLTHDWDSLRHKLLTVGARFATVMAIAPTATSASLMKSTEGIEPIRQLVSMKTGTYSCKQLAPDLTNLRADYNIAWDIDSKALIRLNSVRQRFIDQGQSFSLYYKDRHDSATEVLGDIIYAEAQGVKSLYYAHTPKPSDEELEACESCSA